MSVEIFDVWEEGDGPSGFCIPVSAEACFNRCWERALTELNITLLGNGVWLERKDMDAILREFRRVRDWVAEYLDSEDMASVTSHIDHILDSLPQRWTEQYQRLWMG